MNYVIEVLLDVDKVEIQDIPTSKEWNIRTFLEIERMLSWEQFKHVVSNKKVYVKKLQYQLLFISMKIKKKE